MALFSSTYSVVLKPGIFVLNIMILGVADFPLDPARLQIMLTTYQWNMGRN